MEPAGLDQALARIGSAVARLERAVDRLPGAPGPAEGQAFAARHEALRRKVGDTLVELDKLIGSLEQ